MFTADVMLQTLAMTSLGRSAGRNPGQPRARGHAGDPARRAHRPGPRRRHRHDPSSRTPSEHWELVEISLPVELNRYLVDKGSITVDGISLTVADLDAESFTVSLIPETLARTTLGFKQPGDPVNLEVDVIAKYVEKMVTR